MAKVDIYTNMFCGYCHRAKKLLQERGIEYTEFDVMADGARRDEMRRRSGGRTSVPQIFIDDHYVGGCVELYEMDRAGKLAALLGATRP
jgi:glutaredoxin 3